MIRHLQKLLPLTLPPLFLLFSVWWGLPSSAKLPYLFQKGRPDEQILAALGADTGRVLVEKDTILLPESVQSNGDFTARDKNRALRRFLLFTENPDEMLTLAGLAAMKPGHLHLDPREYTYGTAYFWSVGVWLKSASLLGAVNLVPDARFYLEKPDEMGRLYAVGRMLNLVFLGILMWGVYRTGRTLGWTDDLALIAAAAAGLMSGVIIQGSVLKPHLAGAALGMLAFASAIRFARDERGHDFFLSIGLCALAAAYQYTAVFMALFALAILWVRPLSHDGPGKRLAWTALAGLLGATVFFTLNPYHLVHMDLVRQNLAHTAAMRPFAILDRHLIPVGLFLLAISISPALPLVAVAACNPTRIRNLWCMRRRETVAFGAVFFVLFVLASGSVVSDRFHGDNTRFFLLLSIPVFVAFWHFAAWNQAVARILFLGFALSGAYVVAGHYQASQDNRPCLAAAKWIAAHVPAGSRIVFSEQCAPFRHPPINFEVFHPAYARCVSDAKRPAWLVFDRRQQNLGPPVFWCRSACPFFHASFAEQEVWIYYQADASGAVRAEGNG